MVWMALDPTNQLSHEAMKHVWATLNPKGLSELTFTDFLHGMRKCQDDETIGDFMDISKPNKWELLSLLVDTPISKREEAEILDSLAWVERMGVHVNAQQIPTAT